MKRPAVLLALVLILLTFASLTYRMVWLGYPVFPTAPGKTWQLTIEANLQAEGREVQLTLGIPTEHGGRMLMEERVASGSLSFHLFREGPNRMGIWSGIVDPGAEKVAYRATILARPRHAPKFQPPTLGPYPLGFKKEELVLADRLGGRWRDLNAEQRLRAVAATARGEWRAPPPSMEDLQAWKILVAEHGRLAALLLFLRAADLSARAVEGLRLVEGIRAEPLTWVEVWSGQRWEVVWPGIGEVDEDPASFLPLATGGMPAARVSGGNLRDIRWILSRLVVSHWNVHFERIRRSDRFLDRWSLFRLPPDFQETFRILLLVPIGTFIIALLRNVAGLPTFGIFMPVLMALAFRNTGLVFGLAIFIGVLMVGYSVRRFLDRLRLLLVPRMSVILILVIACFALIALVGNRLGLREFMAVGLLPFVILTMVIERFFVLIEEAGVREGIQTAAGSAAVSVIAFKIISWEHLQLTFFVYPELLFSIAAFQILLGRYTGYRLSEIVRFRALRRSS